MSDEELQKIRQRRIEELNRQAIQQQQHQQQQNQLNNQKSMIMRQILSSDARIRLENLRMAKAEFANALEMQLIQLFQQQQLQRITTLPMSDEAFKRIILKAQGKKRDTKIRII